VHRANPGIHVFVVLLAGISRARQKGCNGNLVGEPVSGLDGYWVDYCARVGARGRTVPSGAFGPGDSGREVLLPMRIRNLAGGAFLQWMRANGLKT
jgi:hypothetical protein